MNTRNEVALNKVPEVTLLFWEIKIAATTLGETGGDALSMSVGLGYLTSTLIFAAIFLAAVAVQIKAKQFHPALYWTTIVATTTVGTTSADFADRSLGIGYAGGSALLLSLLVASLAIWYRTLGTVSVGSINTPKAELCYWITIMFSQTLGTALGDWTAGLGKDRLRRRHHRIHQPAGADRTDVLLHENLKNGPVLGRVRTHQAAGSGGRRLPRQATEGRWTGAQPLHRIGHSGRHHGRLHPAVQAKARQAESLRLITPRELSPNPVSTESPSARQ
jgi:hypothetical protein